MTKKKSKRPTLDDLRVLDTAPAVATVIDVYLCPACEAPHTDSYEAGHCCSPSEAVVCSICYQKDRGMVDTFPDKEDCEEHIRLEHQLKPGFRAEDLEEMYIRALSEGSTVPRWQFEMAHNADFLIPYTEEELEQRTFAI